MPFATMFRRHKDPGVCADCGRPSRSTLLGPSRSNSSEELCNSCAMWRKTADQLRGGYWGALFSRLTRPQH